MAPSTQAWNQGALPSGCIRDCPGCGHRHLSQLDSLAQKRAFLAHKLAAWNSRLGPIQALDAEAWQGCRDKVCLAAEWGDGGWSVGMRRRLQLIPIPRCPMHSPRVNGAIAALLSRLPAPPVFPLAWYLQSGAQLVLVLKTRERPPMDWLDDPLKQSLREVGIEGLWLHLNPVTGKRVLAKRDWELVLGNPVSIDDDGLRYGPSAFQQLVPVLSNRSLERALRFLQPSTGDRVVDLYCGLGRSLRPWLEAGAEALGVELSGEAVALAAENAPGAELLRGGCRERIPQIDRWLADTPPERRLLYLNPPRTGLEPGLSDWISKGMRPRRLAYLSCSAGTLSRDLQALVAGGYRVSRLEPYDFFPRTYHVETLALLFV